MTARLSPLHREAAAALVRQEKDPEMLLQLRVDLLLDEGLAYEVVAAF